MRHRSTIIASAAVLAIAVVAVYVTGYAVDAGYQIPQENVAKDYLIGIVWAFALGLCVAAWPIRAADKEKVLLAWIAKCWVGLILMLPYEQHYDLDCYSYFYSMRWPEFGWTWEPKLRSRLVVVGVGFVQEHFMDSFHAVKMTFAMIGLVAIFLIYRAAMAVVPIKDSRVFLYFALFPSIIFWSSIIGKDPIVFFGVALYVYGVANFRESGRPVFLVALAIGMAVATLMRVWLGVIMGIPLLYFMIRGARGFLPRLAAVAASALLILVMFNQFASGMDIASADDLVSTTDRVSHQFSSSRLDASGSTRDAGMKVTSLGGMVAFMPIGVFSVLFRPLPGEVLNFFGTLSGLENAALLYLAITSVRTLIRRRAVRRPLLREPVVVWASFLVLIWCWSYGFISVQNLGASVRFRLPIIAVFVGLLLAVRWADNSVPKASQRLAALPQPMEPLSAS